MAFIPIPNAVKVALEFTFGTRTVVVTLGFVNGSAPTPTNMGTLATDLASWWHTNGAPNFTADIALKNIAITDQSSVTGPQINHAVSPADPGTQAGVSEPAQAAIASSFYTNTRGRSYRGRAFWPSIPAGQRGADAQHVVQAYVNALAGAVTLLGAVGTGAGWTQAVLSRRANKLPRPTGISTPVTSYLVNTRFDTQRRRIGGVSK